MTAGVTAVPLQSAHSSGLVAVLASLEALHRQTLRVGADDATAVRTSVANLVAGCPTAEDADHAATVLVAIGERHPARSIVVIAEPERPPRLEADIALHCAPGTARVCTELVRLVVHGESAYHLGSIVTPLLVPDIPVHLWLVGAPRMEQALQAETIALCETIVLDSAQYPEPGAALARIAAAFAEHGDALGLGDLAWERTRPWREMIAEAFDPGDARVFLDSITDVSIECAGSGRSAHALLLAGWLASRLGWEDVHEPTVRVSAAPHLRWDRAAPGTITSVRIEAQRDSGSFMVALHRGEATLHCEVGAAQGTTSRTVVLEHATEVDLVGSLIASGGPADVYAAAVARAARFA